jgi:hypothetical protein
VGEEAKERGRLLHDRKRETKQSRHSLEQTTTATTILIPYHFILNDI